MNKVTPFTGSYRKGEVQFLLKPIALDDTPVHIKEVLIQSGQKHYSEMLTHESLPSEAYVDLFNRAMTLNQDRMALHLLVLSQGIIAHRSQGITLVSLARAGTPVGVLLMQILSRYFGIDAEHFSISILRDRGLDDNALRYILKNHTPESLVFVDGWTGKGVISRQLATSLQAFEDSDGVPIPAELFVLTDLSGWAKFAASSEDYLIPSCVLNATISGLVSRSIYDKQNSLSTDFHGCLYYEQFIEQDLSRYFIDTILARVEVVWPDFKDIVDLAPSNFQSLQAVSERFLQTLVERYGVGHPNFIKPGIGEATRVLLRREARLLLLKDLDAEATLHLRWLAEEKSIPIIVFNDLPYCAVALIKEIQL